MVDTEFEAKIRQIIEEVYCCKCTFKIKAKVIDGTYMVYLYINSYDVDPLQIICEIGSDEEFFEWFRKEIKQRNLIRAEKIKINLIHDQ